MVLNKLGDSLRNSMEKIRNAVFIDDTLLNELIKELQRTLLQSDVNVKLVFSMTNEIKKKFKEVEPPAGLTQKEYLTKIVYEQLIQFLGGKGSKISIDKKPYKIMLVGLFGNGKTTTSGKLGKFYSKRGMKVALLSTDTWRPAAFHQLKTLGESVGIDVYGNPEKKNPVEIYNEFEEELNKADVVIIDTAGRDALNDELIEELNQLNKKVQPNETMLVMSADVGQAAEAQAQKFHETVNVTGVIITKLEGTAKGGGAIIACSITQAPVKFIGVGEKIDDLEEFDPERFVGKLLGMGDLEGLLEKARDVISEEDAEDLGKRMLKGEFNLIDLYEQMQAMKKMGPLSKVIDMIPGMGGLKIPKEALAVQQEKLKDWRFIMDSCTRGELEEPDTITGSRIPRIAIGSGRTETEVRELLKQYKQSKKMVKMMKGQMGGGRGNKKMDQMMKQFGGKLPGM